LEKHINDFTILIYGTPEIALLAINLDKHLINEEGVTIPPMSFTQPGGVF
jgi:hypothetical protein